VTDTTDTILLGAHVSTAGGVSKAPARGAEIGATAIQLFTKTPSQWAEPTLTADEVSRFKSEKKRTGIVVVVSHDSYLINLASPDPSLQNKSIASFKSELERCRALGIRFVVTIRAIFWMTETQVCSETLLRTRSAWRPLAGR